MITPLEHGEELTAQDPQACDSVTLPLASTDALPHALALAPVLHQIVFPLYGDIIACVPVPPDPDALAQTPDWQQDIFFFVVAHAGAAQLTQKLTQIITKSLTLSRKKSIKPS